VWDFERDGNVDHQTVNIQFANGATGSFAMVGGSAKSERNIHIVGTRGEIKGTFEDGRFVVRKMLPDTKAGYEETVFDLNVSDDMIGARGGHGGGDRNLVLDFLDYLNGAAPSVSCATLADSLRSHLVVYAADRARKNGRIEEL
jgi:predicted dehydrogenase